MNKLNNVWFFVRALHLFKLLLIIRNNYKRQQRYTKTMHNKKNYLAFKSTCLSRQDMLLWMHPKQKAWSELSTESTGYFGKIWGSNPLMISPSLSDLLFNILNIQCCSNPLIYPSKWSCYIAATALDYSYYHWETPSIFFISNTNFI